jgi:ribosomal protein L7/L12
MDFKTALTAMAAARPDADVSLIVDLALAIEHAMPPNLDDAKALGQWAAHQPSVRAELTADKKIHAIKELRALTHCSLAQAKYAIEAI